MAEDQSQEKKALRARLLTRRQSLPPEEVRTLSRAVAVRVKALECFHQARVVFAYVAFRQEIETAELIQTAWETGKRVAVPRVDRQNRRLLALEIRSWSELAPGTWGIPEPGPAAPAVAPEEIDLALVPGVAFDRRGYRLGYGGGYYDRFLPLLRPEARSLGLAYSWQVLERLPVESTDVPVDYVVTEQELIGGTHSRGRGG
ncbi:MAG: 5-formyltetrahydrofolate cyclo-ligase [Moorellales bacterium]